MFFNRFLFGFVLFYFFVIYNGLYIVKIFGFLLNICVSSVVFEWLLLKIIKFCCFLLGFVVGGILDVICVILIIFLICWLRMIGWFLKFFIFWFIMWLVWSIMYVEIVFMSIRNVIKKWNRRCVLINIIFWFYKY